MREKTVRWCTWGVFIGCSLFFVKLSFCLCVPRTCGERIKEKRRIVYPKNNFWAHVKPILLSDEVTTKVCHIFCCANNVSAHFFSFSCACSVIFFLLLYAYVFDTLFCVFLSCCFCACVLCFMWDFMYCFVCVWILHVFVCILCCFTGFCAHDCVCG